MSFHVKPSTFVASNFRGSPVPRTAHRSGPQRSVVNLHGDIDIAIENGYFLLGFMGLKIVIYWVMNGIYPLMTNIAIENGPVEIVELPS